jgi:hypothetical protein
MDPSGKLGLKKIMNKKLQNLRLFYTAMALKLLGSFCLDFLGQRPIKTFVLLANI